MVSDYKITNRVASGGLFLSRTLSILMTIIILVIGIFAIFAIESIMQRIYPYQYSEIIMEAAADYDLDPYLIAALIHVESKWDATAVSSKGATGLMQLMPDTAAWVSEQSGISYSEEDLTNPEINIMLGSWYLAYLRRQFSTSAAALAAYNGGQGNVKQWLQDKLWDGQLETASDIPFWETRGYVRKLTHTWNIYQKLYDN